MVVKGDIGELFFHFDADIALMMEQDQFEWASLMVFNCERCQVLTPEFVENRRHPLFDFHWTRTIAALPSEWNHAVGREPAREAKLYHYTEGLPAFPECREVEPDPFASELKAALHTVSWQELMGNSVHAEHVRARHQSRVSG